MNGLFRYVVILLCSSNFDIVVQPSLAQQINQFNTDEPASTNTCFNLTEIPDPIRPDLTKNNIKKKIVWLDTLHNGHGLRRSMVFARFDKCAGMASNCEILPPVLIQPELEHSDRKYGPVDADAVLIQGCHAITLPKIVKRDSSQVFVFAERENWFGVHAYINVEYKEKYSLLKKHMDIFNWTMTYRLDSDILFPYGHIMQNKAQQPRASAKYDAIYAEKKHDVVWFVSHCRTQSLREYYVREMQKYINVHIYGGCGNYSCGKHETNCLTRIVREYKFVLSFENTYYPNYVTEKLFSWFPKDIIQVVRGGGIDYSFYGVPERTLIDADSFDSPKLLAKFMLSVGGSREAYTGYLKRKDGFFSVPMGFIQQQAYCNLCAKLQDVNAWRKSYTHIAGWFNANLFQNSYCPDMFESL